VADAPTRSAETPSGGEDRREWTRAAALLLSILVLWDSTALVVVPLLFLLVGHPVRRAAAFLVGAAGAFLLFGLEARAGGTWYLELAWAVLAGGWFAALTLRRPETGLFHRALGAVGASVAVLAGAFAARPEWWGVVDWSVRDRLFRAAGRGVSALRELQQPDGLPAGFADTLYGMVEVQWVLFPAFLGLATMAGLAVAWWVYVRVAQGRHGALAPLQELRFEDQLIWVFIAGLLMVAVAAGDGWTRAGSNTLVFMGTLYVLRGAAVVLFLNGGLSLLGGLVLAMAMLLVAPVILGAALLIGLGDTWLNVREKVRAATG